MAGMLTARETEALDTHYLVAERTAGSRIANPRR